MKKGRDVMR